MSLLLVFSVSVAIAQVANNKVQEVYSQAQISAMTADEVNYLNFLSEKGAIVSYAPEKALPSKISPLFLPKKTVDMNSLNADNFNILVFDLTILPNKFQSFRIGDTGYVVTIYSQSRLDTMYGKMNQSSK
ncbi:MAG: hypothetical protein R2809_07240 [Flavobacteriales bacterium]